MHRQTKPTRPTNPDQAKTEIPAATPRQVLVNTVKQKAKARLAKRAKSKPKAIPKKKKEPIAPWLDFFEPNQKDLLRFFPFGTPGNAILVYEMIRITNRPFGIYNADLSWIKERVNGEIDPDLYREGLAVLSELPWIDYDPETKIMMAVPVWKENISRVSGRGLSKQRDALASVPWIMFKVYGPAAIIGRAIEPLSKAERPWRHIPEYRRTAYSEAFGVPIVSSKPVVSDPETEVK